MSAKSVHFGVLSGGAGTRLWPISRKKYPKQFYSLATSEPLIVDTLRRAEKLGSLCVLTTAELKAPTQGILNRYGVEAEVVGEPEPKNTAPIIAAFNERCWRKNKDAIVCVFPADHAIDPASNFKSDLERALSLAAEGKIVTMGIPPRDPSTAYGYIETKGSGQNLEVAKFIEKPKADLAKALVAKGCLWNSGIFVFLAQTFREALKKHAPEIYREIEKLQDDLSNLEEVYAKLPSISIDYALMEKVSGLACVKATFNWSDLGSWEEIASRSPAKRSFSQIDASGNFYQNADAGKAVAFVGVNDLVAVDTRDALLIVKKGAGQDVRKLVEELRKSNPKVSEEHVFEERPWGRFEILLDTPLFKSKLISVWPGQRLSYQSHKHRFEHWIIVEGEGEFTLNDQKRPVKAGDYLHIPLGAKHRISNTGKTKLEFVEVQQGTYFGEDDIIRYDDDYGRGKEQN